MLKTIDIINKFDESEREKYGDMIKQVNIPDFYKCIAQFSGIAISKLSDDRIAEYLMTWARNKHRFFLMLGGKVRLDTPFIYENECENYRNQYREIMKKFPLYAPWLDGFAAQKTNNINERAVGYEIRMMIRDLFSRFQMEKSTITHFFKSQLNAPDDLVTEIGKIYENKKIEATHTLSINPVDIMLASENPYDWDSCYRLELERSDSHADGCMAAVLDTSSLISYVWSSEGEYNMYDSFKFKKIRYYRIRQWINISDKYEAIHFASAYPNRDGYDGELNKKLREVVEAVVAKFANVENKWRKAEHLITDKGYNVCEVGIERAIQYGYNEFDTDYIWVNSALVPHREEAKGFERIWINPYNVEYKCACGCGGTVYPSDEVSDPDDAYDGDICYNGDGFCAENYYEYEEKPEPKWCEYCDGDCEQGLEDGDCCMREDCPVWKRTHKPCSLNPNCITCDHADEISTYKENGKEICHANCADCDGCYYWERREVYEKKKKDKEDE